MVCDMILAGKEGMVVFFLFSFLWAKFRINKIGNVSEFILSRTANVKNRKLKTHYRWRGSNEPAFVGIHYTRLLKH